MKASAALRTASSGGWLEGFRSTFTGGLPLFRPDPRRPWTGFPLGRPHAWPRSGSSGGPRGLPPRCVWGGGPAFVPPACRREPPPCRPTASRHRPAGSSLGPGNFELSPPGHWAQLPFWSRSANSCLGGEKADSPSIFYFFFPPLLPRWRWPWRFPLAEFAFR